MKYETPIHQKHRCYDFNSNFSAWKTLAEQ
jgi:hypothetical protein